MTNEQVLQLIGRLTVDNEAAAIRIRELEAELGKRTRHKSNVVRMQPAAPKPDGAPAPAEASPPKETVEADPVPNQ